MLKVIMDPLVMRARMVPWPYACKPGERSKAYIIGSQVRFQGMGVDPLPRPIYIFRFVKKTMIPSMPTLSSDPAEGGFIFRQ